MFILTVTKVPNAEIKKYLDRLSHVAFVEKRIAGVSENIVLRRIQGVQQHAQTTLPALTQFAEYI
jgi:hypothetical protein